LQKKNHATIFFNYLVDLLFHLLFRISITVFATLLISRKQEFEARSDGKISPFAACNLRVCFNNFLDIHPDERQNVSGDSKDCSADTRRININLQFIYVAVLVQLVQAKDISKFAS
jgi:hypothetical protein